MARASGFVFKSDPSSSSNYLSSNSDQDSPGVIEEEFGDFYDINQKGIVTTLGNATDGRCVMAIFPCKIAKEDQGHFDYSRLRQYVTSVLLAHFDTEYYVLYFHCDAVPEGSASKHWLRDLLHSMAEKERLTNVRRIFIVHPTPFVRTLWYMAAPIFLLKFKHKIRYANTLRHLRRELPYANLFFQLPIHVLEQDKMIEDRCPSNLQDAKKATHLGPAVVDAVMRIRKSHEHLQSNGIHEKDTGVPYAIKTCIDYLSDPNILSMTNLFVSSNYNISGSHQVMDSLKKGESVELDDYKDPEMVAAVLKQFFRGMAEPLLTYDLYDDIVTFNNIPEKMLAAKTLILYRLPKKHFQLLAFLLAFLLRVLDYKEANGTNSKKLAAIFAPLLVRPSENHASLAEATIEMYDATEFLKYLLDNFLQVFTF